MSGGGWINGNEVKPLVLDLAGHIGIGPGSGNQKFYRSLHHHKQADRRVDFDHLARKTGAEVPAGAFHDAHKAYRIVRQLGA